MILVDTSAWVEYLRNTGSPACCEVERLLKSPGSLAITEPIRFEVLAGARDEDHLRKLRGLLGFAALAPCTSYDFDVAATLYRRCRRAGATVRSLIDCLIAAVTLRHDAALLHADADFDALARHADLTVHVT